MDAAGSSGQGGGGGKQANAAATNTTGIWSDNREAPYAMHRTQRRALINKMPPWPSSYLHNTAKENTVLEFVDNFRDQFTHLYPTRAPLLLAPLNECDQRKFISTFIRPTLLPYLELYDYKSCASYVANYLQYDAPGNASDGFPQTVVSPTTTLAWQCGNSIEESIVLTSLLIGAGYNAFVVLGYASTAVAEHDMSVVPWPGRLPDEEFSDDAEDHVDTTLNTRLAEALKRRPRLESEFDRQKAATEAKATATPPLEEVNNSGANGGSPDGGDGGADDAARPPWHAWVLLLPKKRKIEKPVFIEPSTGAEVPLDSGKYVSIEAVFNHRNYFVNMDPDAPPARLSYDMYDLTQWEHVFLSDPQLAEEEGATEADPRGAKVDELTSDLGEAGDYLMDVPASWVDPLTLSRAQYENRYPGRKKRITYADNVIVTHFAEHADAQLRVLEVRMADPEALREQVHTLYKHRKDMLRRISVYPSVERSGEARLIREWYLPGKRRDTHVEALREVIDVPGVSRELRFYWRSREDGLATWTELYADGHDLQTKKIIERYRGRVNDRLYYRSATFDSSASDRSPVGTVTIMGAGSGVLNAGAGNRDEAKRELPQPIKMAEKFRRNPNIPAKQNVMKRVFYKPINPRGEIWVHYHFDKDSITHASRYYLRQGDKDRDIAGASSASNVAGGGADGAKVPPWESVEMPMDEKPRTHEFRDELKALLVAEKECLNEIRQKFDDCNELHKLRNEKGTEAVLSVYDTLRSKKVVSDAERDRRRMEEERKKENRKDILATYIAGLEIAGSLGGDFKNVRLTKDQAKLVRDNALKDLRDRLIQRGHIMQARMDKEKEDLARKQAQYQKTASSEALDGAGADTNYTDFLSAATWRMKILDDRLTRHIEQASEKYAELAKQLAADPRLAAFYEGQ